MKIVVGSDHAGFPMKAELLSFVKSLGHEIEDVGSYDPEPVDFPDIAREVAAAHHLGQGRARPDDLRHRCRRLDRRQQDEGASAPPSATTSIRRINASSTTTSMSCASAPRSSALGSPRT